MIEFISRLPQGYQEVEYLESSGTQYIVVDLIPNQNTRLDMLVEPRSVAAADSGVGFIPYGSGESYNSKTFECYTNDGGKLEFNYDGQYKLDLLTVSVGTKINISHNKNNILVTNTNGQTIASHTFNYTAFTCPRNLALFAINRPTAIAGRTRIYSCQIYNDTTLAFDLVPCYRKADNVAGLYDLVHNIFYTNAGSGVFVVGANTGEIVISPGGVIPLKAALRRRMMMHKRTCLPSGYTQTEYIRGTGTQYIDTGFVVNKSDNYVLEIDGLFPSQSQSYQGCNAYMQLLVSSKYGIENESSIYVGDRDTVRIAYANQTETLTVNGSQVESISWDFYSGANVKLGILRLGDANNGWFNSRVLSGTIYGYKVWKNSELVSECIPCIRNSDNIAGMYDIVRKQFIQNAGTGAFNVEGSIQSEYTVTVKGYENGYITTATVGGNRVGIGSTVTVVDGTSCTITISPNMSRYCRVILNGTTVLGNVIQSGRQLVYTFSITNNANIVFGLSEGYPTATITM